MNPSIKNQTTMKKAAKEIVTKKKAVNVKQTSTGNGAKKPTKTSKPDMLSINISPEERWKMIAIAAYHNAEKRGFEPGGELEDWVEAEQEIDNLIPK